MKIFFSITTLFCIFFSTAAGQYTADPCGYPDTSTAEFRSSASVHWGYGFDTLLYDLSVWKQSPFATIDSIGASVQGRALYTVTIQDTSADSLHLRQRVWIHARTHPSEVQGTWVTNEIIKQLIDTTLFADSLRRKYRFSIMPMYNPDGVELGKPRENANGIDIESNWNSSSPQKEVLVLKAQFIQQMSAPNPMKVMLNIHSAFACRRYFVYHAAGGTSTLFSLLEQRFINNVRSVFPGRIEPYNYYVSWANAPALQYPESWCWINHKEKIMALTYEDGNCAAASGFDTTATSILRGIDRFLRDTSQVSSVNAIAEGPRHNFLEQNFPNPFNPSTTITYRLTESADVILRVYDLLGREIAELVNRRNDVGTHSVRFDASGYGSGVYIYRIVTNNAVAARTMHFLK